jgi:hypothetical protein
LTDETQQINITESITCIKIKWSKMI